MERVPIQESRLGIALRSSQFSGETDSTPPRVSVIIPIYAPGPGLHHCLSSVARQTYTEIEILPIDDASPEPVSLALDGFARNDSRWKPVYHLRNMGLAGSLNSGLRCATGSYILILQQDCEILSDRAIEEAVSLLEGNPRWCLSGDPVLTFSEMSATQIAFAAIWNHFAGPDHSDPIPISFSELKCDLFPRAALLSVGGFDERFRNSGEDQVLSHQVSMSGWTIFRTSKLRFVLRSGRQRSVLAHLRKEFLYGQSQAEVLLQTAFASLRTNRGSLQGRARMTNRLQGWLAGLCLVGMTLIGLAIGASPLLLLLAAAPVSRMIVVGLRVVRVSKEMPHPARTVSETLLLTPIDDIVYATAFTAALPVYWARGRT